MLAQQVLDDPVQTEASRQAGGAQGEKSKVEMGEERVDAFAVNLVSSRCQSKERAILYNNSQITRKMIVAPFSAFVVISPDQVTVRGAALALRAGH